MAAANRSRFWTTRCTLYVIHVSCGQRSFQDDFGWGRRRRPPRTSVAADGGGDFAVAAVACAPVCVLCHAFFLHRRALRCCQPAEHPRGGRAAPPRRGGAWRRRGDRRVQPPSVRASQQHETGVLLACAARLRMPPARGTRCSRQAPHSARRAHVAAALAPGGRRGVRAPPGVRAWLTRARGGAPPRVTLATTNPVPRPRPPAPATPRAAPCRRSTACRRWRRSWSGCWRPRGWPGARTGSRTAPRASPSPAQRSPASQSWPAARS